MAAARPDRDALHPLEGKTSGPISLGKEHNSRPHSSRFCLLPAWCSGLLLPRVSQLLAVSDECTLLLPHAHSRTNYLQSPDPHCALLSPSSAPTTWPKMAATTPSTSPRGGKIKTSRLVTWWHCSPLIGWPFAAVLHAVVALRESWEVVARSNHCVGT